MIKLFNLRIHCFASIFLLSILVWISTLIIFSDTAYADTATLSAYIDHKSCKVKIDCNITSQHTFTIKNTGKQNHKYTLVYSICIDYDTCKDHATEIIVSPMSTLYYKKDNVLSYKFKTVGDYLIYGKSTINDYQKKQVVSANIIQVK